MHTAIPVKGSIGIVDDGFKWRGSCRVVKIYIASPMTIKQWDFLLQAAKQILYITQ
jgi:hypothetical protein